MSTVSQHGCVACDAPVSDAFGCTTCGRALTAALRSLVYSTNQRGERTPGYLEDLQAVVTRTARPAATGPHVAGTTDQPLLFHTAASELAWVADNTIGTWARDFADTNPHLRPDYTTVAAAAEWMARWPDLLRTHHAFAELHDEILHLVRQIQRMVDAAPDRTYLGRCGVRHPDTVHACAEDLYGVFDAATVTCRGCGAEHDALRRWTAIQERVRHSVATAAEIADTVPKLYGRRLNVKTIRTWAARGQIGVRGHARTGEALHLVGEVLDWAARSAAGSAA